MKIEKTQRIFTGIIPIIWTCVLHPIWKFSKVTTSFENHVLMLKFVATQLDQICDSNQPVKDLLDLPPVIIQYMQSINMPLAADKTDGDYGSRTTHEFVEIYQALI